MSITNAIEDRLINDAELAGLIDSYRGTPAIFTFEPVPSDAPDRFVIIGGDLLHAPDDTKTTNGREIRRDIRCYTEAKGSVKKVEEIAERIRAIFHNQDFTIDGFKVVASRVLGPITVPTDSEFYGRGLEVELLLQEE